MDVLPGVAGSCARAESALAASGFLAGFLVLGLAVRLVVAFFLSAVRDAASAFPAALAGFEDGVPAAGAFDLLVPDGAFLLWVVFSSLITYPLSRFDCLTFGRCDNDARNKLSRRRGIQPQLLLAHMVLHLQGGDKWPSVGGKREEYSSREWTCNPLWHAEFSQP